jgi:hypothetical protein
LKSVKLALMLICLSSQTAFAAIFDVELSLANVTNMSVASNQVLGEGWETYCSRSIFGTCLEWSVRPTEDHSVSVELADGWTDVFNVNDMTSYANPSGLAQGYLTFTPDVDARGELAALGNTSFDFLFGGELFDINFNVLNPNQYRYTDSDGSAFNIGTLTGLYLAIDINGTGVAFSGDILGTTSLGGDIGDFVRDRNGMLFEIGSSVVSAVPVPAAVWLFGTALLGLVGFSKRRKAA